MYIRHHFLITLAICILLYPHASWINLATLLAFGVLVDADHYIYCIWKTKSWNLKKAFQFYKDLETARDVLLPLHFIEWFIPLLVLAFYFEVFWYATGGYALHMALDYINATFIKKDGRNLTLIGWWLKTKV